MVPKKIQEELIDHSHYMNFYRFTGNWALFTIEAEAYNFTYDTWWASAMMEKP